MVAVPVLLLVGGNIVFSSQDLTGDERFPYMMGQAQARLTYSGGPRVAPQVDERSGYDGQVGKTEPATPIPGWGTDEDSHVRALSALAGGTVISVTDTFARTTIGRKQLDLRVRGVDAGRYPAQTQGLVSLDSGRWPATATEVVVTRLGIYHGLPSSGTLTVTDPGGKATAYTIVGVGEGWIYTYGAEPADLIALPDTTGQATFGTAYLLDRATPVTWAEVKRWADYGLQVTSRYVSAHPPTREELNLPPGAQLRADQSAATQAITAAIMAIGLLLETTLLVGPAFAVSAARQRRTLALAASNGATTAQRRRSVLAQAIVLGVLAALVGAVAGVLGAAVVIAWSRANRPDTFFGPFEVPGWPVGIVVGCAIASAVIAAMIPSRGLGRLDIVGVMRGQNVSPPALVRTPIAGIVLAGLGALSVFWAVAYRPTEPSWVDQVVPLIAMGGAILLVIGALLLVPMVLVIVARLTRPAPVAIRMAMRDAARQRGRATSTVAAILGGTALLSTILVVAASDSAFRERDYQPQLPLGQAKVVPQGSMFNGQVDERWGAIVTDIVKAVDPALKTQLLRLVDGPQHLLQPRIERAVVQLGTHLVVLAQVSAAERGLIDLGRGLLGRHAHLGFDDVQHQRPIVDAEHLANPRYAELGALESLGQLLGDVDVQQPHAGGEGKAVAGDREQQHRHIGVGIPGRRGEAHLDDGLLGAVRRGDLVVAQHLAAQLLSQLRRLLADIHPARGRAFQCQPLYLFQVIDEVRVDGVDRVFKIIRAHDEIIIRHDAFPHVVEHVRVVQLFDHGISSSCRICWMGDNP